jgi:hypothetical protein
LALGADGLAAAEAAGFGLERREAGEKYDREKGE